MAIKLLKTHVIQRHKYGPVDPETGEKTLIPTGCDVWPIVDDGKTGREFKFWKRGHDLVADGPIPDKWSTDLIQKHLDAEAADAAELATIKAEVEPAKIDALLAYAKANPDACAEELEALARKKVEGV